VGKIVYQAAAKNLTPVTLELRKKPGNYHPRQRFGHYC
jgi:hypothetical protein